MELLRIYTEEIRLGVMYDPHTKRRVVLTEMVTVCPCCHSFHSLRVKNSIVSCAACGWNTQNREAA